jgi:hypothetical protein
MVSKVENQSLGITPNISFRLQFWANILIFMVLAKNINQPTVIWKLL